MDNRGRVVPKQLRPFKKGYDSRRNAGNKNKEASDFAAKFRNALAEKLSAEEVADILIAEVERKRPWAIQEFLDRLMGKSSQPLEHSGIVSFEISDKFLPKDKDEPEPK